MTKRDRRSLARRAVASAQNAELELVVRLPGRLARSLTRRATAAGLPLDRFVVELLTSERASERSAKLGRVNGHAHKLLEDAAPRDATATTAELLAELLGETPEAIPPEG